MATASQPIVTIAEYLQLEAEAPFRSEWINGQIVAMAGGTETHALICSNVTTELSLRLRGSQCRVYGSDMMTRTAPEGIHTYPDATVVCGPSRVSSDIVLLNPKIIVEVLSKSSENYDRGEKFVKYRDIESFEDYLLVSQTEALVEHHHKEAPGVWMMREYKGLDQAIRLDSVGIALPVTEIYRNVNAL